MLATQVPIGQQLAPVKFGPAQYQFLCTPGKKSGKDVKFADSNRCLELAILGVEMRRSMLIKKHADDNAIENTNGLA
jgi:hypothetical protein